MPEARTLTVICPQGLWDCIHESLFFSDVLLAGLHRPVVYKLVEKGQPFPYGDDILIVNLCNCVTEQVVEAIAKGCRNVGVVGWCHTVSEQYGYYPYVDYVLRPYYSPPHFTLPAGSRCAEIAWIPNGYKSGVGPRRFDSVPTFANRSIEFFYSGFPNTNQGERSQMLAVMEASKLPGRINITDDFGSGMSINSYRTTMEQTRFALVPGGANAETIRLFEALELGSIPISLKHDFLQQDCAMGGAPIVQLNAWAELPYWYQMAKSIPNYPELMESYRQGIAVWWQQFKLAQQEKVANVINRSFLRYS